MKKNFKITLLALSAFALTGVAAASLNNPAVASANSSGFEMTDGAAIRLTDDNDKLGIRFETTMTEAYYNSLVAEKVNPVVKVGAFVNTAEAFASQEWEDGSTALTLPADTENVEVGLVGETSFENGELTYYSKIVYDKEELKTAWEVDDAYINQYFNAIRAVELTAQAYVSVTVGEATTYYFAQADDVTRSMRGVAYDEKNTPDSEFTADDLAPYYGTENTAVENAYLEAEQLIANVTDGTYAVMVGARKCAEVTVASGVAELTADDLNAIAAETALGGAVSVALFNETSVTPVAATKITKLVSEASQIDNSAIGVQETATGRYYVADTALTGELTLRLNDTLKADTVFNATTASDTATDVANGANTLNVKVAKIQRASAEKLQFSANDGKFFGTNILDGLTIDSAKQNETTYSITTSKTIAATDLTVENNVISGVTVANPNAVWKKDTYTAVLQGKVKDVFPVSLTLETADSSIDLTNVYAYTRIIDEAKDLNDFNLVRSGNYSAVYGYYILANNIDASAVDENDEKVYTPANTSLYHLQYGPVYKFSGFAGIFDGRGYEIQNFTAKDGGLFGRISQYNLGVVTSVAFTNLKVDPEATRPAVLAFNAGTNANCSAVEGAAIINNIYVQYAASETNVASLVTVPYSAMVTNTVIDYSKTAMEWTENEENNVPAVNVKTGLVFGTLTLPAAWNGSHTFNPYQNIFIKVNGNTIPAAYCAHESADPYKYSSAVVAPNITTYLKVTGNARTDYATAYESWGINKPNQSSSAWQTMESYGTADTDGRYTVALKNVWDITNVSFEKVPNCCLSYAYYFEFNEHGVWDVANGEIVWKNAQA